jgi:2-haloalkanoic acid dehalogenase type II
MRIDWRRTRALTFDCYGTLIDWEAGILGVLRPWAAANGVRAADADLIDNYNAAEAAVQKEQPAALYPDVLRSTMDRIANDCTVTSSATARDALAQSVGDWPAFSDTADALGALRQYYKLVVVSNVDRASFARTAPKLGVELDGLVIAQDVGAYKPDVRMFHAAIELLRRSEIPVDRIVHVAQSVYHDITPAKQIGLATVWVDRKRQCERGLDPRPDLHVHSLRELASIVSAAD